MVLFRYHASFAFCVVVVRVLCVRARAPRKRKREREREKKRDTQMWIAKEISLAYFFFSKSPIVFRVLIKRQKKKGGLESSPFTVTRKLS